MADLLSTNIRCCLFYAPLKVFFSLFSLACVKYQIEERSSQLVRNLKGQYHGRYHDFGQIFTLNTVN